MWVEPSAESPPQKINSGNRSQKLPKCRCQSSFARSNFNGFLYFVPNILSKIEGHRALLDLRVLLGPSALVLWIPLGLWGPLRP